MPNNKELLKIVIELKSDKRFLVSECKKYGEVISKIEEEKKVLSDETITKVLNIETSLRAKIETLEKQRTENSELRDAIRISKAYVRMLLKEDEVIKREINVVYNIKG